jgi:hypothetical protein
VGGGLGDIEEVLAAGRWLARWGYPVQLYRTHGRPFPRDVDGPWAWPPLTRTRSIRPRHPRALTVSASWGTSAAPARDEPLGRPGAWSEESAAVEAAYGPSATIHLSFEEFARTLTAREQEYERQREGGVPAARIRHHLQTVRGRADQRRLASAYRKFRALDRPNVLHWFCTFARSRSFGREFPEAVQSGPLWPGRSWPRASGKRTTAPARRARYVVWYASPSSSERLAGPMARGLAATGHRVRVDIRSAHAWLPPAAPEVTWRLSRALPDDVWRRRFAGADLRIVTGSRTLLEALELGRPFLYFNGVLGRGSHLRRHRPEKLDALLACWRAQGASARWRKDLASFGRLQRVAPILRRATRDPDWAADFPRWRGPVGFRPPYDDGRAFLRSVAARFDAGASAPSVVAEARSGGLPAATGPAFRGV